MHVFWQPVLAPLLDAVAPRHVVEIGVDEGRLSRHLARWCRRHGARLDLIDPAPSCDMAALAAAAGEAGHAHRALSLDALPRLPSPDLVVVDGDHNWYTVFHEVRGLLDRAVAEGRPPPVLVCHDVAWPYGRRDLYYDDATIPEAFRQPRRRGGLAPGVPGFADPGLNTDFMHAEREGGPRNGVRTAIEDALEGHVAAPRVVWLPVLFGLAVIVPRARLEATPALAGLLDALEPRGPWKQLLPLIEWQRAIGDIARMRLLSFGAAATPGEMPSPGALAARDPRSSLPHAVVRGLARGTLGFAYRGRAMLLNPLDLANYLAVLDAQRPATVFELGVHAGGRSLWLADTLGALGVAPRVIGVDMAPPEDLGDPRVTLLAGNMHDLDRVLTPAILAAAPRPWLVIEDSAHDERTSAAVLRFFHDHLRTGDRIVIEDGIVGDMPAEGAPSGPVAAVRAFLAAHPDAYALDTQSCDRFGHNATFNPDGWLIRL